MYELYHWIAFIFVLIMGFIVSNLIAYDLGYRFGYNRGRFEESHKNMLDLEQKCMEAMKRYVDECGYED